MDIKCGRFPFRSQIKPLRTRLEAESPFLRLGITLDRETVKRLSCYSPESFHVFLDRVTMFKSVKTFDEIKVDSFDHVKQVDFKALPDKFLKERMEANVLDLRDLESKLYLWKVRTFNHNNHHEAVEPETQRPETSAVTSLPDFFMDNGKKVLTAKKLLDPAKLNPRNPYPTDPHGYAQMIECIKKEGGFGDPREMEYIEYLLNNPQSGLEVHRFERKGVELAAVFFDPKIHALQYFNWLIFIADFVSQAATYGAYKKIGCTYDRKTYYEDRIWQADRAGFVFYGDMPVSFASASCFDTEYKGVPFSYAFLHFTMTLGQFQGLGIGSYVATEMLTSMYMKALRRNKLRNPVVDEKGRLRREFFSVWACAHTGRIPAGHTIITSLGTSGQKIENSAEIAEAVVKHADSMITPWGREGRPLIQVTPFGWRDVGIYPPENRQIDSSGKAVISPEERKLKSFETILKILGGEEGMEAGNGAFYAGLITPSLISARRQKNRSSIKMKSSSWELIDRLRGKILAR